MLSFPIWKFGNPNMRKYYFILIMIFSSFLLLTISYCLTHFYKFCVFELFKSCFQRENNVHKFVDDLELTKYTWTEYLIVITQ